MDKSLPMETGCTSKQNENEHDQHSYSNTDPNWAFKFNIPWDLMHNCEDKWSALL